MRHGMDLSTAIRASGLSLCFLLGMRAPTAQTVIDWQVDNLTSIGGLGVTAEGGPKVIEGSGFKAVEFDGEDDGLWLDGNPMIGASEFTIEIIFNPYSGGQHAQRFLHFQQDDGNRILIELRMNGSDQWALDTFINSGGKGVTLLDESLVHPPDTWHNGTLVFGDGQMRHFVNGEQELAASREYRPVTDGRTSLGVRINKVSYFKGAIRHVRVTHAALTPDKFLSADSVVTSLDAAAFSAGKTKKAVLLPEWEFFSSAAAFRPGERPLRVFAIDGKRLGVRRAGARPVNGAPLGARLLIYE